MLSMASFTVIGVWKDISKRPSVNSTSAVGFICFESGSQFLHDQLAVYCFNFAFFDLAHSSLGLFCPQRIDSLLIRAVKAFKQPIGEHRSRFRGKSERRTENLFEAA